MTATNICYNFVGFRCSPSQVKDLDFTNLQVAWTPTVSGHEEVICVVLWQHEATPIISSVQDKAVTT